MGAGRAPPTGGPGAGAGHGVRPLVRAGGDQPGLRPRPHPPRVGPADQPRPRPGLPLPADARPGPPRGVPVRPRADLCPRGRVRHRVPEVGPQPRARGRRAHAVGTPGVPGLQLGVIEHTDRVWVSDCIDAHERHRMVRWTGLTLPPELMGTHVGSGADHTTHRSHELAFRAGTALWGHMGVEWDLTVASAADFAALREWIASTRSCGRCCTPGTWS